MGLLVLPPPLTAPVAVPLTSLKYSNNQQFITSELGKPKLLSIVPQTSTCYATTESRKSLCSAPVTQSNQTPPGNVLLTLPRHCSISAKFDTTNVPQETTMSPSVQVQATCSKSSWNSISPKKFPLLDIILEEVHSPSIRDSILVLNPLLPFSSLALKPLDKKAPPFGRLNPHPNPVWKGPSWASIVSKRLGSSHKNWIVHPSATCTANSTDEN